MSSTARATFFVLSFFFSRNAYSRQVTVFAVNYKGPPFMDGLARNNALIGSLACVAVGAAAAAANVLPVLNTWCV